MPRKVFVANEILTAGAVNTNLMDQAVMVFADAAARTAALGSPSEGMVTYLEDSDLLQLYTTSWGPVASGFTASTTITASDATWTVPSLGSPVVKVTVVGGGGGGGGFTTGGGAGGTSTFNAGGALSVSAAGGNGGLPARTNNTGRSGTPGLASGNGGGATVYATDRDTASDGKGGLISLKYFDLTDVTTVNVTIAAGGSAGTGGGGSGGLGGRGEVIVEYVAGA